MAYTHFRGADPPVAGVLLIRLRLEPVRLSPAEARSEGLDIDSRPFDYQ
jgi:hypothetical protein